ncbi:MAG: universal stress protein, partial [Bacteroidetes bacterium]|nr:universal stress protein [Bacteroidota bacterium]
ADIVMMATHGHSGFAHLILGSTAEKVAQYVKKPVITIRPDEDEFED